MKIFCVILCVFLSSSIKLVIGNKMNEVLLRCKAEVDATDEDVEVFKRGQIPTSYSGLCLLTCLYEHTGIIKDGKFVVENFFKSTASAAFSFIGEEKMKQIIDKVTEECKDVENDDRCILSKDIASCVENAAKEIFTSRMMDEL